MAYAQSALTDDIITQLQALIELNTDSAKGFAAAAEQVDDPSIAALFRQVGTPRIRFAEELRGVIRDVGKTPNEGGTAAGALHRWWLSLRGRVAKNDEHAMLAEAERGEDAIKEKYEKVLGLVAGTKLHEMLSAQYAQIKQTHDTVKHLRDERAPDKDAKNNAGAGTTGRAGTGRIPGRDAGGKDNRDPITGEPGAHPTAVGVGTAAAGLAGGLIGSVAGPVGTAAGTVIGGIAGGAVGRAAGEEIDPTNESAYWRSNFKSRPYGRDARYEDLEPAYRYGWEHASRNRGKRFEELEADLERGWRERRESAGLTWEKAKQAARDAWDRVTGTVRG